MDSWRARRLPLWNEYIFGGVTHLGNPPSGALYPPKVIGLFFDTNRAMGVLVAAHLVLLAVGMVLLVRRLGCRPPASFAAAVVVCANGAVLTRATQFEQILVFAWLPLLLLGVTVILTAEARPWVPMAGTAVVTTLVLLAGHPQTVYQLVFVAILWTAALVFLHRSWRRVADLAIAVGIGAAVAAPQLLASIAAKRDSSLGFGRTLEQLESPTLSAQPGRIARYSAGTVREWPHDLRRLRAPAARHRSGRDQRMARLARRRDRHAWQDASPLHPRRGSSNGPARARSASRPR